MRDIPRWRPSWDGRLRERPHRGLRPLAALLAGVLLGTVPAVSGAQEPRIHPLTFGGAVALPGSDRTGPPPDADRTCNVPCAEPMLAVGPDETLWVSAPRGFEGLDAMCCNLKASPLWSSGDGGLTWRRGFPTPTSDAGTDHGPSGVSAGRNTAVAVDAGGNVYVAELWLGNIATFVSQDTGETWRWSPASTPGTPESLFNRPWMAYSPAHDALFANYYAGGDLWLARADLDGPAGANAGLLLADARVYASQNVACLPVPEQTCAHDDVLGFPGGTYGRLRAPGRPAIDPGDGTIYLPLSHGTPGEGMRAAVSEDGGRSFRYATVPQSGMGTDASGRAFTEAMHPAAAVDEAGNAYLTWVERTEEGGYVVVLSSSSDRGETWSPPLPVSDGTSGTAVFPAIAAGAAGRVAVGWYGAPDFRGEPGGAPAGTTWEVDVAVTLNGDQTSPSFEVARMDEGFHQGSIRTASVGDGRLGDFFDLKVEASTGALLLVYARDRGEATELVFRRQVDGCSLTRPGEGIGAGLPTQPGEEPTEC